MNWGLFRFLSVVFLLADENPKLYNSIGVFLNTNKTQFWIDGDTNSCKTGELISTQSLVFKHGMVVDSFCSGIGIFFQFRQIFWNNNIILKISDYCFRATSSESDLCVENITDWRGSGRFSNQYRFLIGSSGEPIGLA